MNHKFAVSVFGVKIYSYVETTDTNLLVLSTNDSGGETLTVRYLFGANIFLFLPFSDWRDRLQELCSLNMSHSSEFAP